MNTLPKPSSLVASEAEIRDLLRRYRRENWDGIQPVEVQKSLVKPYLAGDWTEPLCGVANHIELSATSQAEPVFLAGTGETLAFGDYTFDLVTLNQVREHVSDQPFLIWEAARVLRPGGVYRLP